MGGGGERERENLGFPYIGTEHGGLGFYSLLVILKHKSGNSGMGHLPRFMQDFPRGERHGWAAWLLSSRLAGHVFEMDVLEMAGSVIKNACSQALAL